MRQRDDKHWQQADRHASLVLMAVMLVIAARRVHVGPGIFAPDLLFWAPALLALLCALEWKALAQRPRTVLSDVLLIASGALALALVITLRGPADFVFVLAIYPLLYLRLPVRLALGVGVAMLAMSVGIAAGRAASGLSLDALVAEADKKMYAEKAAKKKLCR